MVQPGECIDAFLKQIYDITEMLIFKKRIRRCCGR